MVILKEVEYKNSEAAFFEIEPGNPNEDVVVKDGRLTFVWNREKSNSNITDSRSGKGFSFYFARHAFKDEFKLLYPGLASDPKNQGILGTVSGDRKVMIVINVKTDDLRKGVVRIVSAYYTNNQKLINYYNDNKIMKTKFEEMENGEDLDKLAVHVQKILERRGLI